MLGPTCPGAASPTGPLTLPRGTEAYSTLLRLQPDRADHFAARGLMNLLAKDFDAALADYWQVTQLQPNGEAAHYFIGVIHLGRRQYDQAVVAWTGPLP